MDERIAGSHGEAAAAEAAGARTITLTLPDGRTLSFDHAPTGFEVAAAIGRRLARDAVAIQVDGEIRDLARPIERDARVRVITLEDPEALEIIRHDAAHVMAEAVQELYPGTQVTIGPPIETGFYYDFARDEPFTPEDLARIERRMAEIIREDRPFVREEVSREEARRRFAQLGETYKLEILDQIPEGEPVTIYHQGDWFDLCRGPHGPSTGKIGAFKLLKVAGAYWRGDPRNPQLQRIYGTAFPRQEQLKRYLEQLAEAERRDHRRLGREMDLFHFQEEAPGSAFWHPRGWTLWLVMEAYMRRQLRRHGYIEVKTPQLLDRSLWERSGHWDKFRDNMFTLEYEQRAFAIKPMNCPGHVQIFNTRLRSYRELPLRMAEFGSCHRKEPSGALHGLMRVRAFTQDDAHIFCTPDQIAPETAAFCDLLREVYRDFGFEEVRIKFADRPAVRAGDDAVWDQAEQALWQAVEATGLEVSLNPGEGAFYGPKLEFVLRDAIGREWQCGTLQVDFVLPERLDASYVGPDGDRHRPVMLHRAILGSFERFIGVLLEHYAGRLPLWLAPVQVVVATITNDADTYAREVAARLEAAGLRVETDLRGDKISYKVREHSLAKVPVILAVGRREVEARTVTVRRLGEKGQRVESLEAAVAALAEEATPPDLRRERAPG